MLPAIEVCFFALGFRRGRRARENTGSSAAGKYRPHQGIGPPGEHAP